MKLVLKIAAGIVLGFTILWVANVGFALFAISSFSSAMSQMLATKKTTVQYPQAKTPSYQVAPFAAMRTPRKPKHFQFPFPSAQTKTTRTQPRRRIIGYKDKRVAGRPLSECLGPNKELNENVLRCRHGYTKKVPIYSR